MRVCNVPSPRNPLRPRGRRPRPRPPLPLARQNIISGLRQFEDEGAQLSALTELSELLSISQEETLAATVPVEQVVPLLVSRSAGPACWQLTWRRRGAEAVAATRRSTGAATASCPFAAAVTELRTAGGPYGSMKAGSGRALLPSYSSRARPS
jgi:hypothetical protein